MVAEPPYGTLTDEAGEDVVLEGAVGGILALGKIWYN